MVTDPAHEVSPSLVDAVSGASHLMRHRGPDEPGTWNDDRVVLGFNRLSIIDIAHSHQPLRWGPAEAPDRYVLVFNGEIYNYLELREALRADTAPSSTPTVTARPSSRPTTTGAPRP